MRATIIFLNFVIVLFFGVFLAYTFVAKTHIEKLAITFAISKTRTYADPLFEKAEEKFQHPAAQKLIPSDKKQLIENEILAYQKDPDSYLIQLAQKEKSADHNSGPFNMLYSWKKTVTDYLSETLKVLLRDLRIFASSNLIAGSIALFFALRSPPKIRKLLVWLSFLMFLAICYCSYLYIDDLSFFKLLMRWQMGWSYPGLLFLTVIQLFLRHGDKSDAIDEIDEFVSPTKVKTKPRP